MKIKLKQIIDAIEMVDDDFNGYFDLQTGEIVWTGNPAITGESYEERIEQIETSRDRFIRLPTRYDINDYNIMREYVYSFPSESIQAELMIAIDGSGAFRRFKNVLRYHNIEQTWYVYKDDAYKHIAAQWCQDNGLEYEE